MACSISLRLHPALESLGFNRGNVSVWTHYPFNDQLIPLEQRSINLGNPVNIPFRLREPNIPLEYQDLVIQLDTEGPHGRAETGSARVPLQGPVWPGWFIQVISEIHSSTDRYPMARIDVNVSTQVPANYPHPFPSPHVLYPNAGYIPVTPQPVSYPPPFPFPHALYPNAGYMPLTKPQYHENPIFVNAIAHFVGGIFSQIGSEAMNENGFGDFFNENENGFGDFFM